VWCCTVASFSVIKTLSPRGGRVCGCVYGSDDVPGVHGVHDHVCEHARICSWVVKSLDLFSSLVYCASNCTVSVSS